MICVEITAPGGPEVLKAGRAPRSGTRAWRGADSRRGGRREPPRRAAAARRVSAAAGRQRYPGSRSRRHDRRASATACDGWRVGRCASARWCPAAATRRCAWRPRRSACACRPRSISSPRRRSRRPSSRSGPTCSIAAACRQGRRRSFTAARAASARPRFSSPRARGAHRVRHRRVRREVPRLRGARRAARDQLPDAGFRRGRSATLTGGRGVDLILDIMGGSYLPRNLAALAVDGRLVQIGLMGGETRQRRFAPRARSPTDDHRLDAAAAHRSKRRDRSPRRSRARSGRCIEAGRRQADRLPDLSAGGGRRRAPADGVERAHRQDRADRADVTVCGWPDCIMAR